MSVQIKETTDKEERKLKQIVRWLMASEMQVRSHAAIIDKIGMQKKTNKKK